VVTDFDFFMMISFSQPLKEFFTVFSFPSSAVCETDRFFVVDIVSVGGNKWWWCGNDGRNKRCNGEMRKPRASLTRNNDNPKNAAILFSVLILIPNGKWGR
jgi:hypothetical protein